MSRPRLRIGVDLGGTKTEAAILDAAGNIVARKRQPTSAGDYEGTIAGIVEVIRAVQSQYGMTPEPIVTIGVGIPGAVSPATGLVKNANSTWLIGRPLDRDIAEATGCPVRVANDANCFAISEATDGAGAGQEVVFGVILGTGTGGGLVVRGRPLVGANAVAGEWGHAPLPWPSAAEHPGPACYCGRRGCLETYLSGPGLAADHGEAGIDARAIAERAAAGDPAAEAALVRYEDRLARGLAMVINIVDPDVIVLGGGLSNLSRLYKSVPMLWPRYVFSDRVDTSLRPPHHGDSSGVRGAAWLWPRDAADPS